MSTVSQDYLLTKSQELDLFGEFNENEVGDLMTLLDENNSQQQQQQQQQQSLYVYPPQQEFQNHIIMQPQQQYNEVVQQYTAPDILPPIRQLSVALPQPELISNEDYDGPYKFEVFINRTGSKNPWVYSTILNKIFIGLTSPFPIDFKWEPPVKNLFVRATPIFGLSQYAQEMVKRCVQHLLPADDTNRNAPEHILDHVLRCQSPYAEYHGNVDENRRLNILVPLGVPQTGMDTVRCMFSFVCQSSCPTGMNRRPIEVVFTLEDETGNILGRRSMKARICSCPKRDKAKEEEDLQPEMDMKNEPPKGKKRKLNKKSPTTTPSDNRQYTVEISVIGKHNIQHVLKAARDSMAAEIVSNGPNEEVQKCLDKLDKQLKDVQ